MQEQQTIPRGYRKDAKGNLIQEKLIRAIDLERDALVKTIVAQGQLVSEQLAQFKEAAFASIHQFCDVSAAEYGAKLGGKKGNITLYSFDGQYKVQVAVSERIAFDERLQAAKALIDACINEWSKGSRKEIKVLVQSAFDTDQEGKINASKVLALRRLEIEDERWQNAMAAIGDSLHVVASKSYIRLYERVGETEQYVPIGLDVAGV